MRRLAMWLVLHGPRLPGRIALGSRPEYLGPPVNCEACGRPTSATHLMHNGEYLCDGCYHYYSEAHNAQ